MDRQGRRIGQAGEEDWTGKGNAISLAWQWRAMEPGDQRHCRVFSQLSGSWEMPLARPKLAEPLWSGPMHALS